MDDVQHNNGRSILLYDGSVETTVLMLSALSKKKKTSIIVPCIGSVDRATMMTALKRITEYSELNNLAKPLLSKWLFELECENKTPNARLKAIATHVDEFINKSSDIKNSSDDGVYKFTYTINLPRYTSEQFRINKHAIMEEILGDLVDERDAQYLKSRSGTFTVIVKLKEHVTIELKIFTLDSERDSVKKLNNLCKLSLLKMKGD